MHDLYASFDVKDLQEVNGRIDAEFPALIRRLLRILPTEPGNY